MKRILTIFILTTLLAITSCSENKKQELKGIKIGFANAEMNIPKNYLSTSIDDFEKLISNSDKPELIKQQSVAKLEHMRTFPTEFQIFIDSTDIENNIWFQEGEYVELSKSIAQQYLSMLDNKLNKEWSAQGIKFKRVRAKYFTGLNSQIIKYKYLFTFDDYSRYATQYILSSKRRTVGIIVNSKTTEDFEKLIRRLKMK